MRPRLVREIVGNTLQLLSLEFLVYKSWNIGYFVSPMESVYAFRNCSSVVGNDNANSKTSENALRGVQIPLSRERSKNPSRFHRPGAKHRLLRPRNFFRFAVIGYSRRVSPAIGARAFPLWLHTSATIDARSTGSLYRYFNELRPREERLRDATIRPTYECTMCTRTYSRFTFRNRINFGSRSLRRSKANES